MFKGIIVIFIAAAAFIAGCKNDDSSINPASGSNHAPTVPSNPTPPDGAVNVPYNVALMWECSDPDAGDTLRFDVYTGISNPPTNLKAEGILEKVYDLGIVSPNTRVYWKIIAKDNKGASTNGPVWNFTTAN